MSLFEEVTLPLQYALKITEDVFRGDSTTYVGPFDSLDAVDSYIEDHMDEETDHETVSLFPPNS